MVVLADTKKVHDFSVQIVQHFDRRRFFAEEHVCAARERFDIRSMFGEQRDDLLCNPILSSDIRNGALHIYGCGTDFIRLADCDCL
jgi:hypothetical protein